NRTITVDARVVAATNRDLEAEVAAGRFRQDLLYRLNVHVLRVPALRERLSDLPALVAELVTTTCARFGVRPKKVDGAALESLLAYEWKRNNVRELRNVVERMIIATETDVIALDVGPAASAALPSRGSQPRTRAGTCAHPATGLGASAATLRLTPYSAGEPAARQCP